jgi:hypothetical protein
MLERIARGRSPVDVATEKQSIIGSS